MFSFFASLHRWRILRKVNALEPAAFARDDAALRKEALSLRYRAKCGEPLAELLPESYALVREAARRTLNMRHFDVQILGGTALFYRSIAEMQTGEGKTLTAVLPMFLYALAGKGALLATVNDYLAKRDAEWMQPIYHALGMTVGIIQTDMPPQERRRAYHCDITYGTAKEFGFDFLKDRLLLRKISEGQHDLIEQLLEEEPTEGGAVEQPVQREPFFALVDEADSILIDEAGTPLIISASPTESARRMTACYRWAADAAPLFQEKTDYTYDRDKRKVELTQAGRQKGRAAAKPAALDRVGLLDIYHFLQRAILVQRNYHRDEHYVVRSGEIVIVDEFTGRLGEGRKWKDGIHQAIEAKEHVEGTIETGQAARVMVQDFFLRFEHLAGMTGTAFSSRRELQTIYRCRVVQVPTNHPPKRIELPVRIYQTESAKWEAVVNEVIEEHAKGRPVLIGTRTIEKSQLLSEKLTAAGIKHAVLNAYRVAEESAIIARAGERGKVTVSTNMAGRGTDIKIADDMRALGGLHVICTEMHESARIDRQLIGRCGRQGDPGTYRQYLSLEDELLRNTEGIMRKKEGGGDRRTLASCRCDMNANVNVDVNAFRRAQRKAERKSFRSRKVMLYYEKERKKMQRAMGQDPYLDAPDG